MFGILERSKVSKAPAGARIFDRLVWSIKILALSKLKVAPVATPTQQGTEYTVVQ